MRNEDGEKADRVPEAGRGGKRDTKEGDKEGAKMREMS